VEKGYRTKAVTIEKDFFDIQKRRMWRFQLKQDLVCVEQNLDEIFRTPTQ
jgi:hypothetical protein